MSNAAGKASVAASAFQRSYDGRSTGFNGGSVTPKCQTPSATADHSRASPKFFRRMPRIGYKSSGRSCGTPKRSASSRRAGSRGGSGPGSPTGLGNTCSRPGSTPAAARILRIALIQDGVVDVRGLRIQGRGRIRLRSAVPRRAQPLITLRTKILRKVVDLQQQRPALHGQFCNRSRQRRCSCPANDCERGPPWTRAIRPPRLSSRSSIAPANARGSARLSVVVIQPRHDADRVIQRGPPPADDRASRRDRPP